MIEQLAAMPKYEAYKESGEAWISEIPKHWEIRKLKQIFYEKKHKKNTDLNCGSISYGKVVIKDDEKIPYSTKQSYQEVLKGEFLINPLNLNYDLISLRISLSSIDVVVSPGYIVLNTHKDINKEYFKYLLHRYDVAYMKLLGSGVRQTINFNHIANSILLFPPLSEQTAIAAFLDYKTAQIDQAVAIKEKQIALLKERKQILIQNAVTRGLNSDVLMCDSGIEWIGEIPAHWGMKKLKHGIDILTGFPFTSENYSTDENDIRLLRGVNISPGYTKWDEVVYWSKDKISDYESYRLESGDLVIAMDRPWVSSGIRVAKIGSKDLPSLLLQRVARIRGINNVLTDYVHLLLSTQIFLFYFEPMLTGVSVPHISSEQIESFVCPLPPENEQREILTHIETESAKIDQAISIQQQQIDKLKEYKATLINRAVTGKIRVSMPVEGKKFV